MSKTVKTKSNPYREEIPSLISEILNQMTIFNMTKNMLIKNEGIPSIEESQINLLSSLEKSNPQIYELMVLTFYDIIDIFQCVNDILKEELAHAYSRDDLAPKPKGDEELNCINPNKRQKLKELVQEHDQTLNTNPIQELDFDFSKFDNSESPLQYLPSLDGDIADLFGTLPKDNNDDWPDDYLNSDIDTQ